MRVRGYLERRLGRIEQRRMRMLATFIATTTSAVVATAGGVVTATGGR